MKLSGSLNLRRDSRGSRRTMAFILPLYSRPRVMNHAAYRKRCRFPIYTFPLCVALYTTAGKLQSILYSNVVPRVSRFTLKGIYIYIYIFFPIDWNLFKRGTIELTVEQRGTCMSSILCRIYSFTLFLCYSYFNVYYFIFERRIYVSVI